MTLFHDRATISGAARITPEGYFVADALVARANNVQDYRASELGLTDRDPNALVRVFRPEAEVFAADSIATAARLPITLDHPVKDGQPVMVDAANWQEFARGQTDGEVLRDGEFMRVPLRVTDAGAVTSVARDRKEFSLGYVAQLRLEPGKFGDQAYDAVMTDIRYNHLAAVRTARGGAELRIVDERTPAVPATGAKSMRTILVDGLPVNIEDAASAEAVITKLVADRDAAVTDCRAAQAQVAERDTTIAARDTTIAGLETQLAAATLTPAALRDAARTYAVTRANAALLGATVTDEMDEPALRAAAVSARLGDKAATYTPEQHAVAFDTMVAALGDKAATPETLATDAAPTGAPVVDALRATIISAPVSAGDAEQSYRDARQARLDRLANGHRGAAKKDA